MRVLSVARHLNLPDWLVFSGAVYQPVLNHLTGRSLDYGIKDYDDKRKGKLAQHRTYFPGNLPAWTTRNRRGGQ
jgi:Nucleotidyltransferase